MHRNITTRRFTSSFFSHRLHLPIWRSALVLLLLGWCLNATASTFTLADDRWESLVIPANPDGRTVGELLGDDLPIDSLFGSDWAVFTYNPQIGTYNTSSLDEVLIQGRAFWIIQRTGEAVVLDVPDDLPAGDYAQSGACASDAGCFEMPLPADSMLPAGAMGQRFDFVGAPFAFASNLADVRLQTTFDGDTCEAGCDLAQAAAQSYTLDQVWIYDDSINNYLTPGSGDTVAPWRGYWVVALQAVEGKSPSLLLPYNAPTATLAGRVTTPDGQAVAAASVLATNNGNSAVVLTDNNGNFSLSLAADTQYTLSIATDEHADQVKVIRMPAQADSLQLDITLLDIDYSASFDAATEANILAPKGATVEVAADSFVDANGLPVIGDIDIDITSVDVSNPAVLAAFPGDFDGIDDTATATPIISLGTTHFAFSQAGQPVQLAGNTSADITIPIFSSDYQSGDPVAVGDAIPLWSLNEATGIWQQEGTGTVVAQAASPTGLALSATVSHFSWWNCDVTMNPAQVRIAVQGSGQGSALISAVASGDLGWRPTTVDTQTSIGLRTPPLNVPSGREVCYSAAITYLDGATATTDQQCRNLPAGSPVTDIDLTAPDAATVLTIETNIAPGADDHVLVSGYIGAAIRRLRLLPFSIESSVTYAVTGNLPPGLTIQNLHATGAEIVGVPTTAGTYDVLVTATNAENESDTVAVRYVIDADIPAPVLPSVITAQINANFEENSYNFNNDNLGGPATQWALIVTAQPLPAGMQFDANSGIVSIPSELLFNQDPSVWNWAGEVQAVNAVGSSTATVTIEVLLSDGPPQ
jgi:hypothetical protein